jgi:hypothetical protein
MIKLTDILQEIIEEKKADRCKRIADRKYSKPSAYKSGAIVRCRKGKIWKGLKEVIDPKEAYENFSGLQTIIDDKRNVGFFPLEGTENKGRFWNLVGTNNLKSLRVSTSPHDAYIIYRPGSEKEAYELKSLADKYDGFLANKDPEDTRKIGQLLGYNPTSVEQFVKTYYKLDEAKKETLRTWFKRKGAPGKTGGWVDCNTCRDGKCKPCGRKKGEVRAKYPSCRPTPAQCKRPGKGKTWGKTK